MHLLLIKNVTFNGFKLKNNIAQSIETLFGNNAMYYE